MIKNQYGCVPLCGYMHTKQLMLGPNDLYVAWNRDKFISLIIIFFGYEKWEWYETLFHSNLKLYRYAVLDQQEHIVYSVK